MIAPSSPLEKRLGVSSEHGGACTGLFGCVQTFFFECRLSSDSESVSFFTSCTPTVESLWLWVLVSRDDGAIFYSEQTSPLVNSQAMQEISSPPEEE